jgi:hypothetical protein
LKPPRRFTLCPMYIAKEARITLDLEWLRQTKGGGVPGHGPHVKHQPMPLTLGLGFLNPPPPPDPSTYWLMEPSNPATSLRRHREPFCAIHGWGLAPTRLRRGTRGFHHWNRGREGKGTSMTKKKTMKTPSRSSRYWTHHHDRY